MDSEIFRRTLANTLIFTISAQIIGLLLGKIGAMLLMQEFPGRRLARALIVLPWAVPVSLATLAWVWMFDSLYSVINWTLVAVGLIDAANRPQWLGQEDLAMIAVATVHAWRLFPFGVVIFLAGFTSVPQDVLDAAAIDGAGFWRHAGARLAGVSGGHPLRRCRSRSGNLSVPVPHPLGRGDPALAVVAAAGDLTCRGLLEK
jgi:multiple sugar transport system permease protein